MGRYSNRYFFFSTLTLKNTEVVLEPCCTWKYVLTNISIGMDIPESPRVLFVVADDVLVVMVTKLLQS